MKKVISTDSAADNLLVRVIGGEQPGATFSQRVGPFKLNGKVIGEEIKKLTAKDFRLQRVHVLLTIKDRKATSQIWPSTSQVIIRELKETKEPKKKGVAKAPHVHNGSLSFNTLLKIAAEIRPRSKSSTIRGTIKEVLGTVTSVGCLVEGKSAKEVTKAVTEGRSAVANLLGLQNANSLPSFLDE